MESIKDTFPKIIIQTPNNNMGYAGGCNFGAKASESDFLFFLNDDTSIDTSCMSELIDKIQNNNNIGSVQPKILNEEQLKDIKKRLFKGGISSR